LTSVVVTENGSTGEKVVSTCFAATVPTTCTTGCRSTEYSPPAVPAAFERSLRIADNVFSCKRPPVAAASPVNETFFSTE
jgi:hypothetical protein